jgi:hypothetical protein
MRFVRPGEMELGYAEITSSQTFTSPTYAKVTGLLVAGMSIPVDRAVMIEFYSPQIFHSVANGYVLVAFDDDPATTSYGAAKFVSATAGAAAPGALRRRLPPGVCPPNLQVYAAASAATGTLAAGTGASNTLPPAFLRVFAI